MNYKSITHLQIFADKNNNIYVFNKFRWSIKKVTLSYSQPKKM